MSKPLKILILDDDIDLAESIADVLEIDGHEVTLVHDGPNAIEIFTKAEFDVAFFDVSMPGMNGVESFIEIKRIKPDAKVFMMTGYSVEQLLEQALDHGALGILRKPFEVSELVQKLEEVQSGLIVVADDDPEFTSSIIPILEHRGYAVTAARTGEAALEAVKAGNVTLLILDLNMPILSGLEVYLELRRAGREVPTIVVTAFGDDKSGEIDQLRRLSVTGCLFKPFDPEQLLELIDELFVGHSKEGQRQSGPTSPRSSPAAP